MENPAPHDQDDTRSASEKSSSDQSLVKQASQSSSTQRNSQMPDSTPTAVRSEQSTWTPAMPPPPRPNFKATPTSAQPSSHFTQDSSQELPTAPAEKKHDSGRQRTTSSKDASQETPQQVTRKRCREEIDRRQAVEQVNDDDDDDDHDDHDQDATDEFNEPANAISPFDWADLQRRYHDQVEDYDQQEQDLYRQFGELSNVSFPYSIKLHSTDNISTFTPGLSPEPVTRRIEASSGTHFYALLAATEY